MENFTTETLNELTPDFCALFRAYFAELAIFSEDLRLTDEQYEEVFSQMGKALQWKNFWLVLLRAGETPAGFANFQIDSPEKDWCDREGWGLLREWYVAPFYRRRGAGRSLARAAEDTLRAAGAKRVYLTADPHTGEPFWEAAGYRTRDEVSGKNRERIYEKTL